jgi:hypothetical protein
MVRRIAMQGPLPLIIALVIGVMTGIGLRLIDMAEQVLGVL